MAKLIKTPVVLDMPGIASAVLDPDRIGAVLGTGLLDSGSEQHFNDLVELARSAIGVESVVFTLVDASRAFRKAVSGRGVVQGSEHPIHDTPCGLVVTTGAPLVVDDVAVDDRVRGMGGVAELSAKALCCVPVRAPAQQIVGALCAITSSARAWTDANLRTLSATARSIGSQIEVRDELSTWRGTVSALGDQLAASEHELDELNLELRSSRSLARTLQNSLLPPALAAIPGADTAAMYLPANAGIDVVGDFYDLFPAGDSWCVLMGDVCGSGLEAAKVTALARYTVRAEATQHPQPHVVLNRLHEAMRAQRPDTFLTAVVAMLAPDGSGGLRGLLCAGGHEPALIRRIDGQVESLPFTGPALGVKNDPIFSDSPVVLAPGDLLLLYTDGVTESRPRSTREQFGDDRLAATLAATAGLDAEDTVETIIDAAVRHADGGTRDDTAVLAIRAASDERTDFETAAPDGHRPPSGAPRG